MPTILINNEITDAFLYKYRQVLRYMYLPVFLFSLAGIGVCIANQNRLGHFPLSWLDAIEVAMLLLFVVFRRVVGLKRETVILILIYSIIFDLICSDIYLFTKGNPVFIPSFINSSFIVMLYIALAGVFGKINHILILGGISVIRFVSFAMISGDAFILNNLPLDTIVFIGIIAGLYLFFKDLYLVTWKNQNNEKELEQKNSELGTLLEFKRNMLGMVIHDLRNPVNNILYAAKADRINAEEIRTSGNRILFILQNVMDVYKMEESQLVLHPEHTDLSKLVDDVVTQSRFLLTPRNIQINKIVLSNKLVYLDPIIFERIVMNLLSNAIRFSPVNGTVDLVLEAKAVTIRVEISDRGEGIEPEIIPFVFDKFYQGENQKSKGNHVGLGLAFCKMAVERHGGEIGIQSMPGCGTTLWFEIPAEGVIKDTTTEKPIYKTDGNLSFTTLEKIQLNNYLKDFPQVEIYQTGTIVRFLASIPDNESPNIKRWKEAVLQASLNGTIEEVEKLKSIQ